MGLCVCNVDSALHGAGHAEANLMTILNVLSTEASVLSNLAIASQAELDPPLCI